MVIFWTCSKYFKYFKFEIISCDLLVCKTLGICYLNIWNIFEKGKYLNISIWIVQYIELLDIFKIVYFWE